MVRFAFIFFCAAFNIQIIMGYYGRQIVLLTRQFLPTGPFHRVQPDCYEGFSTIFKFSAPEVCGDSGPVELKVKEFFLSLVERIRLRIRGCLVDSGG